LKLTTQLSICYTSAVSPPFPPKPLVPPLVRRALLVGTLVSGCGAFRSTEDTAVPPQVVDVEDVEDRDPPPQVMDGEGDYDEEVPTPQERPDDDDDPQVAPDDDDY
jgi:hypothetical protein